MTISCKWDWNKLVGPVYCLPGFQLVKHFQLLKKLKNATTEKDSVDDFTKSVSSWIEACPDLHVNEDWTWPDIESKIGDNLTKEHQEMLKDLFVKDHGEQVSFNCVSSTALKKLLLNEKKSKENELGNIEVRIQQFKMKEAFLESFPQFILQTCATFRSDPSFDMLQSDLALKLTLLSSLISVVSAVTSAYMNMPVFVDGEKVLTIKYWKNLLLVGILMLIMVTPRLVIISIFFACCRYQNSALVLFIALSCYGIPYWLFVFAKFKEYEWKCWRLIAVNFATSLIGPCIVMDPKSSLIFVSYIFSMFGYLILLIALQMSSLFWPQLFTYDESLSLDDIARFSLFFMVMVPIVIITSLFSYLQMEEEKQLLALKIGLGSVCCEEKDEFKWALERKYDKVTQHLLDSGKESLFEEFDFDFIDGQKLQLLFLESCQKGWINVVKKLLRHPENDSLIGSKDEKGETGILKACNGARTEVVMMLLQHPSTRADEFNLIFIKACKYGWVKILKELLKHPNSQEFTLPVDNEGELVC